MNYKILRVLAPLLFLGALLVLVVSSATATPTIPNPICGLGVTFDDSGIGIKKEVHCEYENAWEWTITNAVDPTSLELPVGASAQITHTVNTSAMLQSRMHIYGTITVVNYLPEPVTLISVSDSLGPITCPVTFPFILPSKNSLECSYSFRSLSELDENTATVTVDTGLSVSADAPIDWSLATNVDTDECVLVTDTFAGELGTACAGAQTSFDFSYTQQVGPYTVCGIRTVENTAIFTTNDSSTSGSASATLEVDVPCVETGCTRSHSYWKTHTIHGPAPYDPTWDARDGGDGEFLGTGQSYYNVLWTSSSDGNAYIILAHPYIAAEMNQLAGASIPPEVYTAFIEAAELLTTYQDNMSIPQGPDRTRALTLAILLNKYNVGKIGPGACTPTYCGTKAVTFNGLGVSKTVKCEKARSWSWDIEKTVDQPVLFLPRGGSATVNYTVTASALANGTFYAYGPIEIKNLTGTKPNYPPATPITIASVTDSLGGLTCPVSFPFELAPSESIRCWYDTILTTQPNENVVTVVRDTGETHTVVVPIDWSHAAGTETDECARITDTFSGVLGNVCANTQTTFTFTYPRQFGPYFVCGTFDINNTAIFTTNDSRTRGSASAQVNVNISCDVGCTLTQGYWKTHTVHGPAPYDDAWDARAGGDAEFLDTGLSYFEVLQTNASGGNAFYILAHQFIAAEMNQLNGASFPTEVQSAFNQASALLVEYQYALSIPRGDDRNVALVLAATLDDYNNGLIGPGHCSE